MSPIEQHLAAQLTRELAAAGMPAPAVTVLSAAPENWRYRVEAQCRAFEIGFNHRERLWCREVTPGGEKHFVSNDHPKVVTSAEARRLAVRLLQHAAMHPDFAPRDPPVI